MTPDDKRNMKAIRALGFATYYKADEPAPFAFTDEEGDALYFETSALALATAQEYAPAARVAALLTRTMREGRLIASSRKGSK